MNGTLIYETSNFIIEAPTKPFVSREEGGHIRLRIKDESITDRTKLTPKMAIEYMKLSMVVGEAMELIMNEQGVPVIKINYQDMGNWPYKDGEKPVLHYHIFGRVLGAKHQPYPESVHLPDKSTGFYEGFHLLTNDDIVKLKSKMEQIMSSDKYLNFA